MNADHAAELADARAQVTHYADALAAAEDAAANQRSRSHMIYGDEQSFPCSTLHAVRTAEDRRDEIAERLTGARAYVEELERAERNAQVLKLRPNLYRPHR